MSSDDGGSWAPFGPAGDDDPPPRQDPPPEPAPAPPQTQPPPVEAPPQPEPKLAPELPPAAAFAPPVAPAPTTPLTWPTSEPTPPPAPAPAPPPPISTWPGASPPAYGAPQRIAGNATASLVLGIVGLVMCPLIASAAAIGLGSSAKREISANPELGGEAQAKWGIALGWAGVVIGVLGILVVIAGAASV